MQIFPNITSRFADQFGTILKPWIQYLQQFTSAPPGASSVGINVSPFTYSAVEPGQLAISGGIISKLILIRGGIKIDITGTKIVSLSVNDSVQIVYSVVPTVLFLPSYGANTQ